MEDGTAVASSEFSLTNYSIVANVKNVQLKYIAVTPYTTPSQPTQLLNNRAFSEFIPLWFKCNRKS